MTQPTNTPTGTVGLLETVIYGDMIGSPFEAIHFFLKNYGYKGKRITYDELLIAQHSLKICDFEDVLQILGRNFPKLKYGLKKLKDKKFTFELNKWTERNLAFTDDTVMTIATADALIENPSHPDFRNAYRKWGRKYPDAGYGKFFKEWIFKDTTEPINSLGNGGAMRMAPIGFALWRERNPERTHMYAKQASVVSHDNPEGIRGSVAVASAITIALMMDDINSPQDVKGYIQDFLETEFYYDLSRPFQEVRDVMQFSSEASKSVPESIIAFLESTDPLDAVHKAITLGGDQDTMACIAGGIATACYRYIPDNAYFYVRDRLPKEMIDVLEKFQAKFNISFPVVATSKDVAVVTPV